MLEEALLSFALGGAEWVLWLLNALSVACLEPGAQEGPQVQHVTDDTPQS